MFQDTLQKVLGRPKTANKYDFGHVLIIGGSEGTAGAPLLAATAALRIGAGLATIAAPTDIADKLEERTLDVMTLHLTGTDKQARARIVDYIAAKKVTAVAIGSGLLPPYNSIAQLLVPQLHVPIVLDASALTCFSNNLELLAEYGKQNGSIIVTPHTGEYQALTGNSVSNIPGQRKKAAEQLAHRINAVVVLKGHGTVVTCSGKDAYVEHQGNPGLAKAGSGDVLTGIIAGLLAQGVTPFEAATTAVHMHALAGDLAAETESEASILASDLPNYLSKVLHAIAHTN